MASRSIFNPATLFTNRLLLLHNSGNLPIIGRKDSGYVLGIRHASGNRKFVKSPRHNPKRTEPVIDPRVGSGITEDANYSSKIRRLSIRIGAILGLVASGGLIRYLAWSRPAESSFSDHLKVVPIEGKGLGVVAARDIEAYTLICVESPAAIATDPEEVFLLCGRSSTESIMKAYHRMVPEIKTRFEALHEGARPFEAREERIWATNCFYWDKNSTGRSSAIFLDLSRINYSCLPNAENHRNPKTKQMELYSTRTIRAGEEVTISYTEASEYRTASERNAYLRYIYGFTCTCRACSNPSFTAKSDQRRQLLKQYHFCGILGQPVAPDFSAKGLKIDGPSSIQPVRVIQYQGFPDGFQIFRPGTEGFMRRSVKLLYDEGITDSTLLQILSSYAVTGLCNLHNRMKHRGGLRSAQHSDLSEIRRLVFLAQASTLLLSQLKSKDDPGTLLLKKQLDMSMGLFNVLTAKPMSVAEAKQAIHDIMSEEPDPLNDDHWRS